MVTYKGIAGQLMGETSIESEPFVTWHVQLITGVLVSEPMWCFEMVCESVLREIQATPIEHWSDIK